MTTWSMITCNSLYSINTLKRDFPNTNSRVLTHRDNSQAICLFQEPDAVDSISVCILNRHLFSRLLTAPDIDVGINTTTHQVIAAGGPV